jgi:hypothetical protein
MTASADQQRIRRDGSAAPEPGNDEAVVSELLGAAVALNAASARLTALDAESRAIARLVAEALLRGDVSPSALELVADVEGRSGILHLLRGSVAARSV